MSRIDRLRAGLALGLLTGGAHLAWVALVAAGLARWGLNLIFRLHFVRLPFEIEAFELYVAVILVGLTTLSGFALGWLFATIWNGLADFPAAARLRKAPS